MENWRTLPHSVYEVSATGRVRKVGGSEYTPVFVKGYACVNLRFINKRYQFKVHTLVCIAFNGVRPSGATLIRHLDGDKLNNDPKNLRWGTDVENAQDTILHGRQICGFDHPNVHITKEEARTIRAVYLAHMLGRHKKAKNGFVLGILKKHSHLGYKCVYKACRGAYDDFV